MTSILGSGNLSSIHQGNKSYLSNYSKNESFNDRRIHELKVTLVGDVSTGKTSVVKRFTENTFNEVYKANIGVEFRTKSIFLDQNNQADLKIWDTCGEEKFRSVTKTYYRNSNCILLLFDLGDRETFNHINSWISDIKDNSDKHCTVFLVGNKSDLGENRKVTKEEAEDLANQNDVTYMEVSAKGGDNIELLFEKLSYVCVKKIEDREKSLSNSKSKFAKDIIDDRKKLEKEMEREKKVGCC